MYIQLNIKFYGRSCKHHQGILEHPYRTIKVTKYKMEKILFTKMHVYHISIKCLLVYVLVSNILIIQSENRIFRKSQTAGTVM